MCDIGHRNLNTLHCLQRAKENNNLDTSEESDLHSANVLRHGSFVSLANAPSARIYLSDYFPMEGLKC